MKHQASTDTGHAALHHAMWVDEFAERGFSNVLAKNWVTSESLDALVDHGQVIIRERFPANDNVVMEQDGHLVLVRRDIGGALDVRVAGPNPDEVYEAIIQVLPVEETADSAVEMEFWMNTGNGPRSITRKIETPAWGDIIGNYSGHAWSHLERLMESGPPTTGGQLLLWHGEPGTGKTYAIRSLARTWKPWAKSIYITDSEEFFGSAAYMLHVLLNLDMFDEEKWRLVIVEDAGELLAADARERTGQGLSRLLNVADGIIGQGLKVLFLITTNEELGRLHPAVTRPGRCLAEVEFGQLSQDEAASWLRNHGVRIPPKGGMTLAEMYARVEADNRLSVPPEKQVVGFAR